MSAIEIRNLEKSYTSRGGEQVLALTELTLDVRDQEFLVIIGPSGCGKTTLLKAIAGLAPWNSGSIRLDGEDVTGPGPERAVVFQNFALLPWASVITNVAFGLQLQGVSKPERLERARTYVDRVGLSGFESRLPHELSGGMQQRVGLARALCVRPSVLLMDEPFGALDEQTRRLLQEELLAIWEADRTTVVFITHSMEEAVLLGDRVALMSPRPGRILELVDVPLKRPRASSLDSTEQSAELLELSSHLWFRLRGMQHELQHQDPAIVGTESGL